MNDTAKLIVGAFIAGALLAGFAMLKDRLYDWADNTGGSEGNVVGRLVMVPESAVGYRTFDGIFSTNKQRLCLRDGAKCYQLVFTKDSDANFALDSNSTNWRTVFPMGKEIRYNPSSSFRVSGRISSYEGLIPKGKFRAPDGQEVETYDKEGHSRYWRIVVGKMEVVRNTP
jgi:hypothetical protein